jgi:hypothetical protein
MLAKRFHESNAITVSGVHGEARRLRVAADFLAAAERARPLAVWPMLRPQAGRPFATRRGIQVDRGRNRFSFRRRFPCSLLPTLCARLLSRARHAIHSFRRCDPLCVPVFRCISICRREASPLSRPSNCMSIPSEPLEGRNGQGEGMPDAAFVTVHSKCARSGASRLDHCLFSQSSNTCAPRLWWMPARS